MGINKVILVGNVGKDPEVKIIGANDTKLATFPMATTETYKTKDNKQVTNTEWHNIVVWRGLAGVVEQYVKKGSPVYVEGKIKTETWDGKNGEKKYRTTIVANELQLLGSKSSSQQTADAPKGENDDVGDPESDDLPF